MDVVIGSGASDYIGTKGRAFIGSPDYALSKTIKYAGKEGYVASMPHLLQGKVISMKKPEHKRTESDRNLLTNWFTSLSEECVGIDKSGKYLARDSPIYLCIHGGGILSLPERIKRASSEGLTPTGAAKLSDDELSGILSGKLPNGKTMKVYSYENFVAETALPPIYGIVLDFNEFKIPQTLQGSKNLLESKLFVVRAGSKAQAKAFLDGLNEHKKSSKSLNNIRYRNGHMYSMVNPEEPQVTLLQVHNISDLGISVAMLNYDARFVGVSPNKPAGLEEKVEAAELVAAAS